MSEALKHGAITDAVIGAAFEVHNVLGYGFLEKVYQRAMQVELQRRGPAAEIEFPVKVRYKGEQVGDFFADLLVAGCVVVELKVAKVYNPKDEAQLLNELKGSGIEVGLLINFGEQRAASQTIHVYAASPAAAEGGPGDTIERMAEGGPLMSGHG